MHAGFNVPLAARTRGKVFGKYYRNACVYTRRRRQRLDHKATGSFTLSSRRRCRCRCLSCSLCRTDESYLLISRHNDDACNEHREHRARAHTQKTTTLINGGATLSSTRRAARDAAPALSAYRHLFIARLTYTNVKNVAHRKGSNSWAVSWCVAVV